MTKALATIPTTSLGLENVSNSDLVFPRLILTQALSKFVQEDGVKPGVYVNSLTKQVVSDTTFIPVIASKYWDLLKPEAGRMVFEARVTDENDERLKERQFWSEGDKKADVNTVIAVIGLMGGNPVVIPFTKSSFKAGKTLLTMAKMKKGPFFGWTYKLAAKKEVKGSNSYWVTDVVEVGPTPNEQQQEAYSLYQSLAPKAKSLGSAGLEGDTTEEVPF